MKCHYEVLCIGRDATEAEVKTAYKKLALRWHPDKNLDNPAEAKEQFQFVQQAYEVLSDRQERAWYDNHREQILRGSNKDYEDKSLDVFQYFTTSCFKGYNNEEKGFYTVYRKVFEDIMQEDLEFIEDKTEFIEIPQFGNSESDYDAVVGPFYNYWMSYSTKKSFVWLDPYDIKDAREQRRILKLAEKENKKVRAKAKKERNEEVRNLVAFVRKRDRRVQANIKRMEEKSKENKLKQEELSKQRRAVRKDEIRNSSQADWSKFDNVKSELEEIERSLAEEFGEEISDDDEEEEEDDVCDNLYCVACNKVFKTPRAFENHESSKKHRENVELLKSTILLEEEEFMEEEEGSVERASPEPCEEINLTDDDISIIDENELLSDEVGTNLKPKKKNKKAKNIITAASDSNEELSMSHLSETQVEESNAPKRKLSKKQKKKNREKEKVESSTSGVESGAALPEDEQAPEIVNKKKHKKESKKLNGCMAEVLDGTVDKNHCCVACSAKFDSKNKLFEHLKKTGHSLYLPPEVPKNVKTKKKGAREK